MSTVQRRLEEVSRQYASSFNHKSLSLHPQKKYILVTCQDARIDTSQAFGIDIGDAHVIRNSGPSVQEALRSIIISQQMMGTREVVVIKHTGCGLGHLTDEDIIGKVEASLGLEAAQELRDHNFRFLGFGDIEQAVAEDVEFLRSCKQIVDPSLISGWVYDTNSGLTKRIL